MGSIQQYKDIECHWVVDHRTGDLLTTGVEKVRKSLLNPIRNLFVPS
jgi:hypothetical protein